MAQPVIMPRQGQSVESCIITEWHKKVGDSVAEGDILFSYETDKSTFDEPAHFSGTLLAILANEGDVVPCLDTVCYIGEAGEDVSALSASAPAEAAAETASAEEKKEEIAAPVITAVPAEAGERVRISPRAKNLALQSGVDMTKVAPTGPHGRIIERDINTALDAGFTANTAAVEAFLAGQPVAVEEEAPVIAEIPAAAPAAAPAPLADDAMAYEEEAFNGVRRVIARQMHASLSEMAQLTLNSSFDATALMNVRAMLKEKGEDLGLGKISLNDMVLFAVSRTLLNHKTINANVVDDKFRFFKHANIGLAVDTERGLLVPTLFKSEELSLSALSAYAKSAAAKARDGKLTPDEMSGGSFTVTNLGSLGVESFTPVINPPQTAILGVCAITQRIREDGSVYPAMGLSLTFDHRAVDGAPAARFLSELCKALENFELLLAK